MCKKSNNMLGVNITRNYMQNHIIVKLVNADINKLYLNNIAHRNINDLAVVYSIDTSSINEYKKDYIDISNQMYQNLLYELKLSEEQFYKFAIHNTQVLLPATIQSINIVLENIETQICEPYVLSNVNKFYGAATILYPDTLTKIRNFVKEDAFIIPSSKHEFLIIKKRRLTSNNLKNIIKIVNSTIMDKEDVLSNNVYQFDYETNIIFNTQDNSIFIKSESS